MAYGYVKPERMKNLSIPLDGDSRITTHSEKIKNFNKYEENSVYWDHNGSRYICTSLY